MRTIGAKCPKMATPGDALRRGHGAIPIPTIYVTGGNKKTIPEKLAKKYEINVRVPVPSRGMIFFFFSPIPPL